MSLFMHRQTLNLFDSISQKLFNNCQLDLEGENNLILKKIFFSNLNDISDQY